MRKAGAKSYEKYSKILLKFKVETISLEVFADNFKDMEKQALKINSCMKNIYVKIPVVNSKGKFTVLAFANKRKESLTYHGDPATRPKFIGDWNHETDAEVLRSTDKGKDERTH